MKFLQDPINLEFVRLLNASEWTMTRAAKELSLQVSTVSEYVAGNTRPSQTVLRLFKLILAAEKPEAVSYDPAFRKLTKVMAPAELQEHSPEYGVKDLVRDINEVVPEEQQRAIDAARGVVKAFPKAKKGKKAA